jgi:acetolactate synthase I/II/III large subunit
MPAMSVADLIVSRLRDAGVRTLFGVPGGGSTLDVIQSAGRIGLPFVLTATETAAAIAAIAQAEISGEVGVCLTTLGPGVASVVNGVACAKLERAPLIVLTDSHPTAAGRIFEHQRLDHHALLAPITKWSATITAADAGGLVDRAVACVLSAPPGPVHLECPADVASQPAERGAGSASVDTDRVSTRSRHENGGCSGFGADDLKHFDRLVARARMPLLLVGLGALRPADRTAIRALCDRHHVPAMVTYRAKGVVADVDPHFAGVFTNGATEAPLLELADLLIGIGLDPIELIPRPWQHGQPIIYCGPWPVAAGHVPFAAQIIGDVARAVGELNDRLRPSSWDLDAVARLTRQQRNAVCPASESMAAHDVVRQVAGAAAGAARVTVDAGAHMFPATMLWPVDEPNRMLISNGLSTMGFALPAAIGAALLDFGMPVVALTGDGGLLMCAGELLTVSRENLRVITVVFNDGSLSLIDVKQRQRRYAASGVTLGAVAWASLAESVGMAAHVATTGGEVTRAIEQALGHPGPSLIDARVNPSTYADTLRAIRG